MGRRPRRRHRRAEGPAADRRAAGPLRRGRGERAEDMVDCRRPASRDGRGLRRGARAGSGGDHRLDRAARHHARRSRGRQVQVPVTRSRPPSCGTTPRGPATRTGTCTCRSTLASGRWPVAGFHTVGVRDSLAAINGMATPRSCATPSSAPRSPATATRSIRPVGRSPSAGASRNAAEAIQIRTRTGNASALRGAQPNVRTRCWSVTSRPARVPRSSGSSCYQQSSTDGKARRARRPGAPFRPDSTICAGAGRHTFWPPMATRTYDVLGRLLSVLGRSHQRSRRWPFTSGAPPPYPKPHHSPGLLRSAEAATYPTHSGRRRSLPVCACQPASVVMCDRAPQIHCVLPRMTWAHLPVTAWQT